MRRGKVRKLFGITALLGALAAGPAIYAHAHSTDSQGSGGMMQGGHGGMMGMMSTMGQMSEMLQGCKEMMQSMHQGGAQSPNEQWRERAPGTDGAPETGG